ncbi:MAG: GGDEF domain-containing protein [Patescibacteria group bacterium]|nr:GGDEF domain-containing protein [Patescibacteria group bacterium]MDD4304037.1 GGDEF domain-containing protein [Patescibacteria group bacterium]MDD4694914.1 GGDEF domain-containing protein [Patescibacteria group bacterium]
MPNNFENPYSMADRVENLRENDTPYEDSVVHLANEENKIRDDLKERGLEDKELVDYLSDKFSTEILQKMEAQKDVYIDVLTGFENRKALVENLPKLLSFEKRNNRDCALFMLDLDHFKSVNDTYGHDAGDVVLKKITEVIKKTLRQSDFTFRYGGEEFVIFLMDLDVDKAHIVAEKIREEIKKTEIRFKDNEDKDITLKKTVSIGCVDTGDILNWQEDHDNIDMKDVMKDLIKKADRALYESKETGRDKITIYKDLEKNRV